MMTESLKMSVNVLAFAFSQRMSVAILDLAEIFAPNLNFLMLEPAKQKAFPAKTIHRDASQLQGGINFLRFRSQLIGRE